MKTQEKRIRIFDTTLREGEQSPDAMPTWRNKVVAAMALDRLGVDVIEAGCLASNSSNGEKLAVKAIVGLGLNAEVCALARARKDDIDEVKNSGAGYVHTYMGTSDSHLRDKFDGITRNEALRRSVAAVAHGKSIGLRVEFSAEDATNTDMGFLKEVYRAAEEAGADRINIPDTLGRATQKEIYAVVAAIRSAVSVPISIHCHNDFGQATANTLAAIDAGASCAQVTISGFGERVGNAPLEHVVAALHFQKEYMEAGYSTGIRTEMLTKTWKVISRLYGIKENHRNPIVGNFAFRHKAGPHAAAVINSPSTYEHISPEEVGNRRGFEIGKLSGWHVVDHVLKQRGILLRREQLDAVMNIVRNDSFRRVTEEQLCSIAMSQLDI
jgi:2-isopropylmalate synthase